MAGIIKTVAVVIETVLCIIVFCREAMAEQVNKRAGCGDEITEGVVRVLGNCVASSIKVARDIAVVVVAGNVD